MFDCIHLLMSESLFNMLSEGAIFYLQGYGSVHKTLQKVVCSQCVICATEVFNLKITAH